MTRYCATCNRAFEVGLVGLMFIPNFGKPYVCVDCKSKGITEKDSKESLEKQIKEFEKKEKRI